MNAIEVAPIAFPIAWTPVLSPMSEEEAFHGEGEAKQRRKRRVRAPEFKEETLRLVRE